MAKVCRAYHSWEHEEHSWETECFREDDPESVFAHSSDSEFEEVSFTPGECQLGGHYTYERRKLDDVCFNGKEYQHASPLKKSRHDANLDARPTSILA